MMSQNSCLWIVVKLKTFYFFTKFFVFSEQNYNKYVLFKYNTQTDDISLTSNQQQEQKNFNKV